MDESSCNTSDFGDNFVNKCDRETNENDTEQLSATSVPDDHKNEEKQINPDKKNNDREAVSSHKVNNHRRVIDLSLLQELRLSVIQGNFEAVKSLIESKGVFVDSILRAGWNALMYACSFAHQEIVEYLLKQNADPNFHKDMFTPLMACCASRRDNEDNLLKCVVLLLEKGAKVNVNERHRMTPLLFATRQGYYSIVQKLIENGAEINRRDTSGYSALLFASNHGYGQIVRLLLDNGADPTIKAIDGQSAADLAYSRGYAQIAEILTEAFEKEYKDPHKIPERNKFSCVRNATHFSELELFFVGIGRGDLLPIFYENELSYKDLLTLNEEDLKKIGVMDQNDREVILKEIVCVNESQCKTSKTPEIQNKNILSCTEAVMMMSNISRHLAYLRGTIIYLRHKIQSHPRILELSQQSFNVQNLIKEAEQSIKNAHNLHEELKFLAMYLKKLQDNTYVPADVMTEVVCPTYKPTKWEFGSLSFYLLGLTSLSLVFGSIWWQFPHLFHKYSVLANIIKKIVNR